MKSTKLPPDRSDEYGEHYLDKDRPRKKSDSWILVFVCLFVVMIIFAIKKAILYHEKAAPRQSTEKRQIKAKRLASAKHTVANDAIKALKKIRAATSVGVPFKEYNRLTIEAKAVVDEALEVLPDGELKKEIFLAMDVYADANTVFQEKILDHGFSTRGKIGKILIPKYSLPVTRSPLDGAIIAGRRRISDDRLYADLDHTLQTLWSLGRARLKRVSRLIKQGPYRKSHPPKQDGDTVELKEISDAVSAGTNIKWLEVDGIAISVLKDLVSAQMTIFASSNQYTRNMPELFNAGFLPNPNVRFVLLPIESPDRFFLGVRHVQSESVYTYDSRTPDVMNLVTLNDFHESFHKTPAIARSLD